MMGPSAAVLLEPMQPRSDSARVVSRQVVEFLAPSVSGDRYPIAAKISCVVVDSNGVVGSFIDSALK